MHEFWIDAHAVPNAPGAGQPVDQQAFAEWPPAGEPRLWGSAVQMLGTGGEEAWQRIAKEGDGGLVLRGIKHVRRYHRQFPGPKMGEIDLHPQIKWRGAAPERDWMIVQRRNGGVRSRASERLSVYG